MNVKTEVMLFSMIKLNILLLKANQLSLKILNVLRKELNMSRMKHVIVTSTCTTPGVYVGVFL